jgi:hypothetical protein
MQLQVAPTMKVDSALEKVVLSAGFAIQSLEVNPDVIYIVDGLRGVVYCNAAWDSFARENKRTQLERDKIVGKSCLGGVPDFLRNTYERIYCRARTGKTWEHDYQCSSPTKYRVFHMRVFPLNRSHLLVENSLALERPHRRKRHAKFDARYINPHGWIIMCSHCRRTEHFNPQGKREWHWVSSYLANAPAPISHGLCPACVSYYLNLIVDGQV